jgi:hypothetical protein
MLWVRMASGLRGVGVSKEIKENEKDLTVMLLRLILIIINEKPPFTSL